MCIMLLIPYIGDSAAPLRLISEVRRFTWRWRSSSADNSDLVGVRQFQIRQTKPPILFGIDKLFLTIFCLEASWLRGFLSGKGPICLLWVSSHLEGAVEQIWINTKMNIVRVYVYPV
jgi:hypothetical protein